MPALVAEQLAVIAHELWCARMRQDGWTHGPLYDAANRTHDAIGPFGDLNMADREHARDATRASGAIELLSRCIEYPRGLDLPTPFDRIAVVRRVRLVQTDRLEDVRIDPRDLGIVERVECEDGRTVRAVVRWPSGDRTLHAEGDSDLALVPEM